MAKFTDYTEKTEPVDTDLALIYDTPAKVNKKFTFGNLWKWIAKKIVSEGISQLETTNKTIPGAINELNSKRFNANSYIIYSNNSAKTVSVKWGGVNSHMTSFLLIDNNRNTSAYITGKISGVAEISKGTGSAAPPVLDASLATLKVTLGPWSAAFLICLDLVTIS